MQYKDKGYYDGYPPTDLGISCDGDSIEFSYCLECGQIQSNKFPIPEENIEDYYKEHDDE